VYKATAMSMSSNEHPQKTAEAKKNRNGMATEWLNRIWGRLCCTRSRHLP